MKKIAIVTGASKGIGLALAKNLLDHDYFVIGTSRYKSIGSIESPNFESSLLDLSSSLSVDLFIAGIKEKNIEIDLLINNAGIGPDLDTEKAQKSSFIRTFEVNTTGTVFFTEQILQFIKEGGKILNVSSKMGSINLNESYDAVGYRMSKSALNMYTKILSNRIKSKISVASIHPGWVVTTISKSCAFARLTPEESANRIMDYVNHKFQNGDFWDAEHQVKLDW